MVLYEANVSRLHTIYCIDYNVKYGNSSRDCSHIWQEFKKKSRTELIKFTDWHPSLIGILTLGLNYVKNYVKEN